MGCEGAERREAASVEAIEAEQPTPVSHVESVAEAPEQPEPEQPEPEHCELVDPPVGMVDLATVLPSAIVVAGYHRTDNFTGVPLPGYAARGAWLEREAADALVDAAATLADAGYRLIVYDGYRPRQASVAMVAWAKSHDRLDLITDGWVAPHSAHNRGAAIDLGLADASGSVLDMGSRWDQFDATSHLRGVEGPALERRLLLRRAMVAAGFSPYAREWWHFTYARDTKGPVTRVRDRPSAALGYACRRRP